MNGDTTERLSQESQCPNAKEHGLLARASAFAGGVLSSIQTLAGTTACKGVQIARLKDWAKENDCWIENPESLGVFSDRGSENEVYMAYDGIHVYKLNDFRYSDDNLTPFFERIVAHNQYFTACPYDFIGFSQNRDRKITFHTFELINQICQLFPRSKRLINRKSVGTIAYMPGLRLWKDLLVDNETIAHAMRYIMPQRKGYNNPYA